MKIRCENCADRIDLKIKCSRCGRYFGETNLEQHDIDEFEENIRGVKLNGIY